MPSEPLYPIGVLTVVIRDDAPMVHCNDSPSYRSVRIDLTPEQIRRLRLNCTSQTGYESISKCFIEPGTMNESLLTKLEQSAQVE